MQGGKGSTPAANMVTSRILANAQPIILAEWGEMKKGDKELNGPAPVMAAYADNIC